MNAQTSALLGLLRADIFAACEKFGVSNLDVFGTALADGFHPGAADLEIAVRFRPEARRHAQDNYAGLHERLAELFDNHVDLVSYDTISNLYRLKEIERSRQPIYPSA